MIPRATYRFQFHKDFPFGAAETLIPYLDQLGISHVYASPITTAAKGSRHGYDVVDPTQINPELGGEEAFRSLVRALRARDMGIIIDIVPNHMGVGNDENHWWNDVLAKGQSSACARFFDIDWSERLVLPVLGAPIEAVLEAGDIAIKHDGSRAMLVLYGERCFPIRDEDERETGDLCALLERQHYRLAFWKTANDDLNWRRFFTVNELAGLRIEDPDVFDATHALYFRLHAQGLIDGVRVDHVDGLTDPAGYCQMLRQKLGPDAYVIVEKILGAGEHLSEDWGVDGTSGYDFMNEVGALLHSASGEAPLDALWSAISQRPSQFAAEELQARRDMLAWQFEGQLDRCVSAFSALAPNGVTRGMIRRAIERILWVFPVYRTYCNGRSAPPSDEGVRNVVRARVTRFTPPGEEPVTDLILGWLAGDGGAAAADAVRRLQQLSAPIAAKAVEDTAFYRYGRLLSRTDVGSDAGRFSTDAAGFHAYVAENSWMFPHRLLATATHDHKRGEDVRARLAVLSEIAPAWEDTVARWRQINRSVTAGVDAADEYVFYQTLFGAYQRHCQRTIVLVLQTMRNVLSDGSKNHCARRNCARRGRLPIPPMKPDLRS
jgi:(1->4)-alpha-D-glucan 1-alpha-D-glucosylmutase